MSATALERQAREAYKCKDYARALHLFNRAVARAPSISLLDTRAACHAKLNDLQAALQDAKKAIQLAREDPTGYLRAGKILLAMEKDSVALEIYAHGLKKIKHVGKGFELMKIAHDELQTKLSPLKSVDPLTVLPRELALQVLEYLTFRQRVAIQRVSKQWTAFVRSEPMLWAHLDLSAAKKQVRPAFISRAINVARKRLIEVTLHRVYGLEKCLIALSRYCSVEKITCMETGLIGEESVRHITKIKQLKSFCVRPATMISLSLVRKIIAAHNDTLEIVDVGDFCLDKYRKEISNPILDIFAIQEFPRLSTLISGTLRHEPLDFTNNLNSRLPSLQKVVLRRAEDTSIPRMLSASPTRDFSHCLHLQHLDDDTVVVPMTIRLPPSLISLRLVCARGTGDDLFSDLDHPDLPKKSYYLPCLKDLSLELPGTLRAQLDLFLSDIPPQPSPENKAASELFPPPPRPSMLTSLTIARLDTGEDFSSEHCHPRLEELHSLAIRTGCGFVDSSLEKVIGVFRHLRRLDLTASGITGVSVKSIVSRGTVKELILNDCTRVDRDAIDWARRQGLKVEYKMTPQPKRFAHQMRSF